MIAPDRRPSIPEPAFDLERRLVELEMLLEIGASLSSTLDFPTVLEMALETAEQVCSVETSSIWELDEEKQELFFRVVRGRAAGEIRNLRVPVGQGIVGSVAQTGIAEVVDDVTSDGRWHGDAKGFRTRSILTVPLAVQGSVIGVLQLLNPVGREHFSEGDLRRMKLFAGVLAPALQNARLHAAQQRQFLSMVTALAETLDKKDPYTGGHVRRVVSYSMLLGAEMGLSRGELQGPVARGDTPRHRQDRRPRPHPRQAGPARLRRGRNHEAAHGGRLRDRLPPLQPEHLGRSAQPPREAGRPRLSRRPERPGASRWWRASSPWPTPTTR